MWVAYFDESGTDAASAGLCMAGYVAPSEDWFQFIRAWRAILREYNVKSFHGRELFTNQGQYQGWHPTRVCSFMTDLVGVVNSHDLSGVATGVAVADFERVRQRTPAGSDRPVLWQAPYLLCFHHLVVETAVAAADLPHGERIAFVFDNHAEYRARAQSAFLQMRDGGAWPRGFRLGSITFGDEESYVPLQAADLLAWEMRRHLHSKLVGGVRPMRKSLKRLTKRVVPPSYLDERAMTALLEGLTDEA